jgi:23S rRNA pseudouridine2605 synthase
MKETLRLAKRIAGSGLASRREAERWIEAGRVQLNGKQITNVATNVTMEDDVKVDGNSLPTLREERMVFRFHKPQGCLVTRHDPQGRPTIYDVLPKGIPHLIPVGRLDYNSEGLLLLTTDGDLAQTLMHPKTGMERTYRVRVLGKLKKNDIERLAKGITIEGTRYRSVKVVPEEGTTKGHNVWLEVTLTEGKNREIRRIFEHIGHPVSRLIRTSYGPFQLGKLPRGKMVPSSKKEMETLDQCLTQ